MTEVSTEPKTRIVWDETNPAQTPVWAEYFEKVKERPEPVVTSPEVRESTKELER